MTTTHTTPGGVYYITPDRMPYGPPLDICPNCLLDEISDRVEGLDAEYGMYYHLVAMKDCQSFRHGEQRICIECGAGPLKEGFYMGDEDEPHYRCNAHPIEGWPEQYSDDGQSYWTTWEE